MLWFRRPKLSVVVVVYRMRREAPRTLQSLSASYQHGVSENDYEVIVVENPSDQMLNPEEVRGFGRQFRYIVNPRPSRSPAAAMNLGASRATGQTLLLMVDGARILSPGVLMHTLTALRLYDRPVVATLSWHLGPDNQARSIHQGYCQQVEDQLLEKCDWKANGYRLFEVSSLAGSCPGSWFSPILESNCIAVDRRHFRKMSGFSEEFKTAGGGFVNLDFFSRAVSDPRHPLIFVLGEGSFHQFHGGAATNRTSDEPIREFQEEYQRLRGQPYAVPQVEPILFGGMQDEAKSFMRNSIVQAEQLCRQKYPSLAGTALPAVVVQGTESMKVKGLAGTDELRTAETVTDLRVNMHASPLACASNTASRIVTVLGMHRSGTSCLAGTLMECGVDFGEVSRKNNFNLKGNNENHEIMDLQERILADNGGSWKEPPAVVRWNCEHREVLNEIIRQFRQKQPSWWGFKDPRTLLMLDGWRESLPDMQMVGIFRHPDVVAQSLAHRNLFSRAKGLELWCHYNQRLIERHRQQPFPILFFSPVPDEFSRQLEKLVSILGLNRPLKGFEFFESSLQHFDPQNEKVLPRDVADLYDQLHELAFYHSDMQQHFAGQRLVA